jgi:hypothetical protein
MADSTEQVAVESAAQASTSAMIAVDAANAAGNAVQEIKEVAQDAIVSATVTNAEQAVQIAENTATIAKQEAAIVTQAAVAAIAENEVKESWQDEAIRRLSAESEANSTMLRSLADQMGALTEAVAILTAPATKTESSPLSAQTETPPTVTTETVTESTVTEPPPKSADENQDRKTEARKRVLRFL